MLVFKELEHEYLTDDLTKFKSVSTVINELTAPRDWNDIAEKYAIKKGFSADYWLKVWELNKNIAAERGTRYHKEYERLKHGADNGFYDIHGNKHAYDLSRLNTGEYIELICYNEESGLCGTADGVIIYPDKTFDLYDHKTTAPKNMKFYSFKMGNTPRAKMLYPISHIDECGGMKYTVQLSLYAYMLEQFGFTCRNMWINHVIFKLDENKQPIIGSDGLELVERVDVLPIRYLRNEARDIIEVYKKKKDSLSQ